MTRFYLSSKNIKSHYFACSPIEVLNTVENASIMSLNYIFHWKGLNTLKQKPEALRPMESANVSTEQFRMSFTQSPSERKSITHWKKCKRILTNGWFSIIRNEPTQENTASEKLHGRRLKIHYLWLKKKC